MQKLDYINEFEHLAIGLFVHFGIYSVEGKGEWYLNVYKPNEKSYSTELPKRFKVKRNWARNLVKTAKQLGARYITITARHHDGFSLYDTCGLNDYDALHSATGRDLIKEFTDACRDGGIVPFFYHTLLDWHHPLYKTDFDKYIDYLIASVEILCKNYGKIGGIWFDGMWDNPDADWQEDRLYSTIRKYQPTAMIINNTGLNEQGKVGHVEIDSVTFERGKPFIVDATDKYRAGEMCQVLNDHWGYAKDDCNYKSVKELIENLIDCRSCNCNFLLNTGLKSNGDVNAMDKCVLAEVGKWVNVHRNIIYDLRSCGLTAENADVLTDGNKYYAIIKGVGVSVDPNVTLGCNDVYVTLKGDRKIISAVWYDTKEKINIKDYKSFKVVPFFYGVSRSVRVAELEIE